MPTLGAKAVKEAFALPVSRQAVERYDPTKPTGATLSAELRTVFDATRARLISETAVIGVSHRVVRLRQL